MIPESSLQKVEHDQGSLSVYSPSEECLLPRGTNLLADVVPPYKDVAGKLRKITDGFQLAQVFYMALELDLFSYLKKPATVSELSIQTRMNPELTRLIVGILVGCGILMKDGDCYVMYQEMCPFLLPDSPYYAHYLSYASVQRDFWQDLSGEFKIYTHFTGRLATGMS